jgi:hypothetical protein
MHSTFEDRARDALEHEHVGDAPKVARSVTTREADGRSPW